MISAFRISLSDVLALRKSAVLRLWLLKSWMAWTTGVLYSIFATQVFPRLARPVLAWWFPPVKGKGLLWMKSVVRGENLAENPSVEIWLGRLSYVVWIFGFALVMTLLEVRIRPAIAAARTRARDLQKEAEAKLASDPSQTAVLLRRALDHAVDGDQERELRKRIENLATGVWPPSSPTLGAPLAAPGTSSEGASGRYRLRGELGRGGMGVVWRAWDPVLDRELALKELPAQLAMNPSMLERFRREARALAKLSHPNVVQVHDYVEERGRSFIAMELVDGGDLEGELADGTPPLARALEIVDQLAGALEAAHAQGIVHRDVKPRNILRTASGTLKVTDFGLARLAGSSGQTLDGSIMGTPRYMSPEQAGGGQTDERSDAYSLGATLFHVLAGRPPFDGDTASLLRDHIATPAPPLASVAPGTPPALASAIDALLSKDPAARPPLSAIRAAVRDARPLASGSSRPT